MKYFSKNTYKSKNASAGPMMAAIIICHACMCLPCQYIKIRHQLLPRSRQQRLN